MESFGKRQRERNRDQKQLDKRERRAARAAAKPTLEPAAHGQQVPVVQETAKVPPSSGEAR